MEHKTPHQVPERTINDPPVGSKSHVEIRPVSDRISMVAEEKVANQTHEFAAYCGNIANLTPEQKELTQFVDTYRGQHTRPINVAAPSIKPYHLRIKQDRFFREPSSYIKLTEVSPLLGDRRGNTTVKICVTGVEKVLAKDIKVYFQSVNRRFSHLIEVDEVTKLSENTLLVLTKHPFTCGPHNILVETKDGRRSQPSESTHLKFLYVGPLVRAVAPPEGRCTGNTPITISGSFPGVRTVKDVRVFIGPNVAERVEIVIPEKRIKCTTPAFSGTGRIEVLVHILNDTGKKVDKTDMNDASYFNYTPESDSESEDEETRLLKVDHERMVVDIADLFSRYACSENEIEKTLKVIRKRYFLIKSVFWAYTLSQLTDGQSPNLMGKRQYRVFMEHARVVGKFPIGDAVHADDLNATFNRASCIGAVETPEKGVDSTADASEPVVNEDMGSLSLSQFVEVLVRLAAVVFPKEASICDRVEKLTGFSLRQHCEKVGNQQPLLLVFACTAFQAIIAKEMKTIHMVFPFYLKPGRFPPADAPNYDESLLTITLDEVKAMLKRWNLIDKFTDAALLRTYAATNMGRWMEMPYDGQCVCRGMCVCPLSASHTRVAREASVAKTIESDSPEDILRSLDVTKYVELLVR